MQKGAQPRIRITRQDDQIICLIILSIFVKQRTYLATLANRFGLLPCEPFRLAGRDSQAERARC
jgi:hypothetical protein